MIGDLRATLYDIFGYLLPGIFATLGCYLLVSAIARPHAPLNPAVLSYPVVVGSLLLIGYTVGHLLQAISNVLPWFSSQDATSLLTAADSENGNAGACLSAAAVQLLNDRLRQTFGPQVDGLTGAEKYALVDEARALALREGDREVYVYREGFYRGMAVAAAVLSIGLVVRLFVGLTCFVWQSAVLCFGRMEMFVLLGFTGASILAFRSRAARFARYRVTRAVMLWLATSTSSERKQLTP